MPKKSKKYITLKEITRADARKEANILFDLDFGVGNNKVWQDILGCKEALEVMNKYLIVKINYKKTIAHYCFYNKLSEIHKMYPLLSQITKIIKDIYRANELLKEINKTIIPPKKVKKKDIVIKKIKYKILDYHKL